MNETNCKHYSLKLSQDGLGGFYYTCEDCNARTRIKMRFVKYETRI